MPTKTATKKSSKKTTRKKATTKAAKATKKAPAKKRAPKKAKAPKKGKAAAPKAASEEKALPHDLAELIERGKANGEVSAEIVAATLARLEASDAEVDAFYGLLRDQGITVADDAEKE